MPSVKPASSSVSGTTRPMRQDKSCSTPPTGLHGSRWTLTERPRLSDGARETASAYRPRTRGPVPPRHYRAKNAGVAPAGVGLQGVNSRAGRPGATEQASRHEKRTKGGDSGCPLSLRSGGGGWREAPQTRPTDTYRHTPTASAIIPSRFAFLLAKWLMGRPPRPDMQIPARKEQQKRRSPEHSWNSARASGVPSTELKTRMPILYTLGSTCATAHAA